MQHEMTNKEYNEYVKTKTPNSKLFSNCLIKNVELSSVLLNFVSVSLATALI